MDKYDIALINTLLVIKTPMKQISAVIRIETLNRLNNCLERLNSQLISFSKLNRNQLTIMAIKLYLSMVHQKDFIIGDFYE